MLIDRKQSGWVWVTMLLAALAGIAYWFDPQSAQRGHRGSNVIGLALGAAALLIFVFCALLSLKRKAPHWKVGRAQAWLRGHVWFGLLAVWLVALHSGFGLGGPATTIIWALTGLVTVSALVGLGLQQVTPRLLLHAVPGETVAQQLARLLAVVPGSSLRLPPSPDPAKPAPWPKPPKAFDYSWETSVQEMAFSTAVYYAGVDGTLDKPCPAWDPAVPVATSPVPPAAVPAAATPAATPAPASPAPAKPAVPSAPKKDLPPAGAEPLRRFWNDFASPYFEGRESVLATPGKAGSLIAALKTMTPAHIHPGVEGLAYLIERRRQLVHQRHMQRVLVSWLFVHVPLSWALLVLAIVHAFMALRWIEVPV